MKQLHFVYFLNVIEMIKKDTKNQWKKMVWKSKIQHETNGEIKTGEFHKPRLHCNGNCSNSFVFTKNYKKHAPSLNTSIAFKYILIRSHEKTLWI